MKPYPDVPEVLLLRLEEMYPDRMPDHTLNLDQTRFKQGEASVVRTLRDIFNRQQRSRKEPHSVSSIR